MTVKANRNINLDLMRFLGVLIIMVAHAGPPGWLYQLRNFGTPLLVVASALTYALIYSERQLNTGPFLKKRITRLVFPTWIFLSFFFLSLYLIFVAVGRPYPFSVEDIFASYSFYKGIGFVWILKIYVMLALFTKPALALSQSSLSDRNYFLMLIVLYLVYELILRVSVNVISPDWRNFFNTVIFILPPYFLLYLYGMRAAKLSNTQLLIAVLLSVFIFAGLASAKYFQTGEMVPTQLFKYPPTFYYLSYAFFALNFVYLVGRNLTVSNTLMRNIITWLSANSLWIYLWHIMAFFIWRFFVGNTNGQGLLVFSVKAVFLFSFGVLMTYMQLFLVHTFSDKSSRVGQRLTGLLT